MSKKFLSVTAALMMVISLLSFAVPETEVSAADDVIFSSFFDDGNINDWTAFGGGGKISLDTSASHSGENSLKITERLEAYHGPSINADALFKPEKTYTFTAWAYQASDSEKTLLWTMRYVDSLGVSQYLQIAGADLAPRQWTEMTGTVTIPEDSVSYLLYFECANATVDFNIDDVVITGDKTDHEERGTDKSGYLYSYDFESGNELWAPRGDNRLIRTDEYAYTGSHSIYVTNRNKTWNGPTVNINDVKRGVSYFYSAYVYYNGEEYDDSHVFRMEIQYNLNGEAVYQLVKAKKINKHQWTRITGTYTLPEGAADVSFYIQTDNLEEGQEASESDLLSFYTDTVIISETSLIHGQTAKKALILALASVIAAILIWMLGSFLARKSREKKNALSSLSKDAMTQCFNRNAYEARIDELRNNPEQCRSLYYALCDVNFLKYINDNLGHEKGDEAITRCGALLMEAVGTEGAVYRTGGDEFVCITSKPMMKEIRDAIAKESGEDAGYPFYVASGFTEYSPELDSETPDIEAIIERTDKAMYANKQEIKADKKNYSRK